MHGCWPSRFVRHSDTVRPVPGRTRFSTLRQSWRDGPASRAPRRCLRPRVAARSQWARIEGGPLLAQGKPWLLVPYLRETILVRGGIGPFGMAKRRPALTKDLPLQPF
jgi:hypothetical protein